MIDRIKSLLFGLSVGDALGVPVEFYSREKLHRSPVKEMKGYGSWNQPPGTWSDDSSLAFCLAEGLTSEYKLEIIAENFIKWLRNGYWGAHYKVFDVGGATRAAIERVINGTSPTVSGGFMDFDNGNGSLMRIMPLLFYVKDMPIKTRYEKTKEVSTITHAHFRSVFACFIFLEMARGIFNGKDKYEAYRTMQDKYEAYRTMQENVMQFVKKEQFNPDEINLFTRILKKEISDEPESSINSGGYVLDTLEASIWCILNTNSYSNAVLKAVNLGHDTDTTGCVTGALAGLLYGFDAIPKEWLDQIARKNDILDLCKRLNKQLSI
jgi:ADP-ribosyl-[dinitrogen reductase] hydrolase